MKSLISILTICLHVIAFGQVAKLTLDRSSIKIGEQIHMNLSFEYANPNGDAVLGWPQIDDYLGNDIEVVEKWIDQEKIINPTEKTYRREQNFMLTVFEEGEYLIPPQEITLNDSTYSTDSTIILVETVQVDTSQGIFDIKPIYSVNYPFSERSKDWLKENWYWIAIILAIILGFFIYRYIQKNKDTAPLTEEEVIIPAHIIALNTLDKLLKEEAWKSEHKKNYYSELTDTVRSYLENRFEIHAMEQTTREIIQDLKKSNITEEDKVYLRKILREADMVKFAKFAPNDEDAYAYLQKSIDFVNRTKENDTANNEN
ncbi:BatD family protein [Crocinitomix algicola]|uniref:BatD family protein n=1 Tax=Crocinitomix algicola TaxID=1740263 RepID=UPI00082A77AD|nr:BatD family protein [Crocinitomix algicola]